MEKSEAGEKVVEMKSGYTENGKVCEKYIWKIENFSKLNSECVVSSDIFLSGYAWSLTIFQLTTYLSVKYIPVVTHGSPKEWCRNVDFELVLANVDASSSRTIVKKTRQTFNPSQRCCRSNNLIGWYELCNSSKGFIVNDTCIVEVRIQMISELPSVSEHLENLLPKENSTTAIGDLVDFKGLGKIDNAFVPLLEEVCSRHPSLVDSHRKRKRTRMFTEWAFTALGRVLHFLKTTKVKDMNEDACNHLQILWEELETAGFDLSWLEPHFQSAVRMKSSRERAANVKRLRENVDALEKDLEVAISNLAEAEKAFAERDLDAELGYGAP